MPRKKRPAIARLLARVRQDGECSVFTGNITWRGYGQLLGDEGRLEQAHRVAFRVYHGDIPEGMYVCHRCDNRACVNPEHLFLGTPAENSADMVAKHRQRHKRGEMLPHTKLTADDVRAIRAAYRNGGVLQRELAARYGITKSTVGHILARRHWKHVA